MLTHRPTDIPPRLRQTVEAMSGAPRDVVDRLRERGLVRLYVDGGRTIQQFIAAGLVAEIVVSRLPILIGAGIPLFGPVPADVPLRHLEATTFGGGLVQSRYEGVRKGRAATPPGLGPG